LLIPVEDAAVKVRREHLVIAALLAVAASPLAAQEPVQAPDSSVQGYAPGQPTPTPPPAAAPAPNTSAAPAAAPAPTAAAASGVPVSPTAGQSVAQALGFIDVIPARSTDRIQNELSNSKADEREADARIAEMSSQRAQTKAMIEVKKQEISTVDARIKLADKQKAEGDKTALEAEKKVAERQKQFLERREALRGAELDQAKAAKQLARAEQKALDLELQLANRRDDRARVGTTDPTVALRHDEVIRELERKTLEAQRQRAEAAKDVASRDQDIAKRRLDLYQAQLTAAGGR
jgi:hypothetical protein